MQVDDVKCNYRWLIMKKHEQEALLVLTRINDYSKQNCLSARINKKETFVDTEVEFKDLKEAADATTFKYKDVFRDIFKRKYITRYFCGLAAWSNTLPTVFLLL